MFDRPESGERAVLVHIEIGGSRDQQELDEFSELVRSCGAESVAVVTGARRTPDPRLFVGSGKADEICALARSADAKLIIFDHVLSPSQERNIERVCECRVLDRTGLILDIFAQRARSHEGKLQVELAQLRHLSTRLVRGWSHLERQKGGIGLRGPGETQLETDRRLLAARIKQINKRLEKVVKQRQQGRRSRKKASLPTVALVGYTNAGKSTLFNSLVSEDVYAADQLFATLDPTLRRLEVGDGEAVVIADTVGFIRELPHDLVAAFRATLEETREADLLLHVVDANDDQRTEYVQQVNSVLAEIGAQDVPQLMVFNKIDLLPARPRVVSNAEGLPVQVWLSAVTGAGLDLLCEALSAVFSDDIANGWITLPPHQSGRVRARLFEIGAILREHVDDCGVSHLEVKLSRRHLEEISREEALLGEPFQLEPDAGLADVEDSSADLFSARN